VVSLLALACTKVDTEATPTIGAAMHIESPTRAEEGVVGATCSAKPSCPQCKDITTNDPEPGTNACKQFEEFYPGLTMVVARKHAIKRCQELNALDECGNHCQSNAKVREKNGGGCYAQCEAKTNCIYGDNR
jgi:hypothetical protein